MIDPNVLRSPVTASAPHSLPRISVVVPSFNQGVFLEDCLLSVLGQGYPELEILVLDAGSTDGSGEIIRRYADRLAFWRSGKDAGQAAAINEGFRRSTGEVLCWLNSDDLFLPGTLLDIGRRMAGRTEEKLLVYGACIDLNESASGKLWAYCEPSRPFDSERLTYQDYLIQPSCFWTRALWTATGEIDESFHYALDWDWFIRASRCGASFDYVPRSYAIYRHHPAHKSGDGSRRRLAELIRIVDRYAPVYWQDMYREVERSYERVKWTVHRSARWRIPFRKHLLALGFPHTWRKLRRLEDFGTAAGMCV